jgi:hypothetical protein
MKAPTRTPTPPAIIHVTARVSAGDLPVNSLPTTSPRDRCAAWYSVVAENEGRRAGRQIQDAE